MHKLDYPEFCGELDRLATLYNREKLDDQLTAEYWEALRDLSLEAVKACAALHRKRSKFFPKPAELRPKSEMPREVIPDNGSFAAAESRSARSWGEQLRKDEPLTKWRLLAVYLARTDQIDPSSTLHSERMRFCRQVATRLLKELGLECCRGDTHCMHAISRLLGGNFINAVNAPAREAA